MIIFFLRESSFSKSSSRHGLGGPLGISTSGASIMLCAVDSASSNSSSEVSVNSFDSIGSGLSSTLFKLDQRMFQNLSFLIL